MLPLIPIISGLVSVVPQIAQWIGGDKAEEAATNVANIASAVTGIADPQEAVNQVIKDPKAKLAFMSKVEDNRVAMDQNYLKDRQDARKNHKTSIFPALLSSVLTVGLISFIGALLYVNIPEANLQLINTVFGSYLTAWIGSCAYWFGTTRGSANKDLKLK